MTTPTLQAAVEAAVETIAADVARWPPDRTRYEYAVKRVPSHLALFDLVQMLGERYVVLATADAIVVKRRHTAAARVSYPGERT